MGNGLMNPPTQSAGKSSAHTKKIEPQIRKSLLDQENIENNNIVAKKSGALIKPEHDETDFSKLSEENRRKRASSMILGARRSAPVVNLKSFRFPRVDSIGDDENNIINNLSRSGPDEQHILPKTDSAASSPLPTPPSSLPTPPVIDSFFDSNSPAQSLDERLSGSSILREVEKRKTSLNGGLSSLKQTHHILVTNSNDDSDNDGPDDDPNKDVVQVTIDNSDLIETKNTQFSMSSPSLRTEIETFDGDILNAQKISKLRAKYGSISIPLASGTQSRNDNNKSGNMDNFIHDTKLFREILNENEEGEDDEVVQDSDDEHNDDPEKRSSSKIGSALSNPSNNTTTTSIPEEMNFLTVPSSQDNPQSPTTPLFSKKNTKIFQLKKTTKTAASPVLSSLDTKVWSSILMRGKEKQEKLLEKQRQKSKTTDFGTILMQRNQFFLSQSITNNVSKSFSQNPETKLLEDEFKDFGKHQKFIDQCKTNMVTTNNPMIMFDTSLKIRFLNNRSKEIFGLINFPENTTLYDVMSTQSADNLRQIVQLHLHRTSFLPHGQIITSLPVKQDILESLDGNIDQINKKKKSKKTALSHFFDEVVPIEAFTYRAYHKISSLGFKFWAIIPLEQNSSSFPTSPTMGDPSEDKNAENFGEANRKKQSSSKFRKMGEQIRDDFSMIVGEIFFTGDATKRKNSQPNPPAAELKDKSSHTTPKNSSENKDASYTSPPSFAAFLSGINQKNNSPSSPLEISKKRALNSPSSSIDEFTNISKSNGSSGGVNLYLRGSPMKNSPPQSSNSNSPMKNSPPQSSNSNSPFSFLVGFGKNSPPQSSNFPLSGSFGNKNSSPGYNFFSSSSLNSSGSTNSKNLSNSPPPPVFKGSLSNLNVSNSSPPPPFKAATSNSSSIPPAPFKGSTSNSSFASSPSLFPSSQHQSSNSNPSYTAFNNVVGFSTQPMSPVSAPPQTGSARTPVPLEEKNHRYSASADAGRTLIDDYIVSISKNPPTKQNVNSSNNDQLPRKLEPIAIPLTRKTSKPQLLKQELPPITKGLNNGFYS